MASFFSANRTIVIGGHLVAVLECPFCYEILKVEPPNRLHSAFSLEKPTPKSYHGEIVKTKYKCQNPGYKKPITIFRYSPLEYFNRIYLTMQAGKQEI